MAFFNRRFEGFGSHCGGLRGLNARSRSLWRSTSRMTMGGKRDGQGSTAWIFHRRGGLQCSESITTPRMMLPAITRSTYWTSIAGDN